MPNIPHHHERVVIKLLFSTKHFKHYTPISEKFLLSPQAGRYYKNKPLYNNVILIIHFLKQKRNRKSFLWISHKALNSAFVVFLQKKIKHLQNKGMQSWQPHTYGNLARLEVRSMAILEEVEVAVVVVKMGTMSCTHLGPSKPCLDLKVDGEIDASDYRNQKLEEERDTAASLDFHFCKAAGTLETHDVFCCLNSMPVVVSFEVLKILEVLMVEEMEHQRTVCHGTPLNNFEQAVALADELLCTHL